MSTGNQTKPVKMKQERTPNARTPIGFALLGLALAVIAYLVASQNPSVNLADRVPEDVSLFVEIPSVPRFLSGLSMLKVADPDATRRQTTDGIVGAVAAAFHLTHEDGEALGRSVVGAGYAARVRGQAKASIWLFAVSSATGVDLLLGSNRLTSDGALGKAGTAYRIAPLPASGVSTADESALEKWLRALATKEDGTRLAWFPEARVVALGDAALVRDVGEVIDSGKGTLGTRDLWLRARAEAAAASPGATGLFFADMRALRDLGPADIGPADPTKFLDGFDHDGGAVSGALRLGPAGLVVRAAVPLTGDAVYHGKGVSTPTKLTFPQRLPADTAFYVAVSTHRDLGAAEAQAQITRASEAVQGVAGVDLAGLLDVYEKHLSVTFDDLFAMTGEEAALAVVLAPDFKYSAEAPLLRTGFSSAGVVFAMKVDTDVNALRVLQRVREAWVLSDVGKLTDVTADGVSFVATPIKGAASKMMGLFGAALPSLRVRYKKKEILIVLAQPALADRIFAALDDGTATLAGEPAHRAAMGALQQGARAYSWLDLGRVATLVYAANPGARLDAKSRGWPVDAMTLTGPNRVTMAADVQLRADPQTFTVDLEALNPWGPALVSGWLMSVPGARPPGLPAPPRADRPAPSASAPVPYGLRDPLEQMPNCQRTLRRLQTCEAAAHTSEARDDFTAQEAALRKKIEHTEAARWQFQNMACTGTFFKLKTDPNCPKLELVSPLDRPPENPPPAHQPP